MKLVCYRYVPIIIGLLAGPFIGCMLKLVPAKDPNYIYKR